jgi:hypothetical protein
VLAVLCPIEKNDALTFALENDDTNGNAEDADWTDLHGFFLFFA